jgi:lysozyme family protein
MASLRDEVIGAIRRHEGGFGKDPRDPGNWTGGKEGSGILKGTKGGISAAAYPELDIENLADAEIDAIYARDYWDKCSCDDLPPALAVMVMDAAVQHGAGNAEHDAPAMLQRAIGSVPDGKIGPKTIEPRFVW